VYSNDPMVFIGNMDSYFKYAQPDCSLYSKDNYQILIHKELLYQTKFMREMISGIGIDSNIDVICPSVSKEELEIIVQFLYNGKLVHADETVVSKASKNLEELFGFPSLQGEVCTETVEIERDMDCNEGMIEGSIEVEDGNGLKYEYKVVKLESEMIPEEEAMIEQENKTISKHFDEDEVLNAYANFKEKEKAQQAQKAFEKAFEKASAFLCPHCVKNFPSKQTMLDHILVIHEGKKYHCQFCAKTFNHKCNMQSHVNRVHEGKKPKPAICSQCDKVFTRSNALKRHIRENCMKEKRRLL